MTHSWKRWAERRQPLPQPMLLEGMQSLSIAWQHASEDIRIPLMTRITALPEIVILMNDAEIAGLAGETGDLCRIMNAAPNELREAVMHLREALLPNGGLRHGQMDVK